MRAVVVALVLASACDRPAPRPSRDAAMDLLDRQPAIVQAMNRLDWDEAIALCDRVLKLDPNNELVRDERITSAREKKNAARFEEYLGAVQAGDDERAVFAYQAIDPESVYKPKAEEAWPVVTRAYIAKQLALARQALEEADCDEVRKHVEAVLIVDEANREAVELGRQCGSVKPGSADRLVAGAQNDLVNGRNVQAIDKAREAIRLGATAKAWRIVGAASCNLRNRRDAKRAWDHLDDDMDRQFVKYVCARHGVRIP